MNCQRCGKQVADYAMMCPACGAGIPGRTAPPAGHAPPRPVPVSGPVASFDARRWSLNDKLVGGASFVVLISLFLPWFTAGNGVSVSLTGLSAHGWLWLVIIISVVMLGYLLLTALYQELPFRLPVPPALVLLGGAGLNLLLVFVAFVLIPYAGDGMGWGFGAILGLLAAIVAVVPLAMAVRNQRS
jgi:hypothetical protein